MTTPASDHRDANAGHLDAILDNHIWKANHRLYEFITVGGFVILLTVAISSRIGQLISTTGNIVICFVSLLPLLMLLIRRYKYAKYADNPSKNFAYFKVPVFLLLGVLYISVFTLVHNTWLLVLSEGEKNSLKYLIATEQELRGQENVEEYLHYFTYDAKIVQNYPVQEVLQGLGDSKTLGTIIHNYTHNPAMTYHIRHYRKVFLPEFGPVLAQNKKLAVAMTRTKSRLPDEKKWDDVLHEVWTFRLVEGGWRVQEVNGGLEFDKAKELFEAIKSGRK